MNYLISIALGPVQDFISTARRSRDLWFGSWLLSELSKAVAHEIVLRHKTTLSE
jgi:CRISPR-associated protein Cmr2